MRKANTDEVPVVRLRVGGFNHRDPRVGWVPTPTVCHRRPHTARTARPSPTPALPPISTTKSPLLCYEAAKTKGVGIRAGPFFSQGSSCRFTSAQLPNPGEPGAPHECIADDPHVIEAFARREDKPGRGVYDCVSPLKPGARRRSLETIGEIVALHVDVDGKDLVEDLATIDARLATLPLPPSEVRNSGRGRHVVYALKEPIDAADAGRRGASDRLAQAAHRLPVRRHGSGTPRGAVAPAGHAQFKRRRVDRMHAKGRQ